MASIPDPPLKAEPASPTPAHDTTLSNSGPTSIFTPSDRTELATQMGSLKLSEPQGPAPDMVPSTRPSMPPASMSEVSNITQASVTPAPNLATAAPAGTPPEAHQEDHVDPRVVELQSMFPDFDVVILQSVLDASDGDHAAAVDMLLGMSDPEYKPASVAGQRPGTQSELDELYARQLFEEEQASEQQWSQHGPQPPVVGQQVPYQARQNPRQNRPQQGAGGQGILPASAGEIGTQLKSLFSGAQSRLAGASFGRGGAGNGVQQNGGVGPDGGPPAPELRQQFNEIAETGKKQFNMLYAKVKAKIQEYDPPAGGQQSTGGYGSQPQPNNSYAQAQSAGYSVASANSTAPQQAQPRWNAQPFAQPQMTQQEGYHVQPPTPSSPTPIAVPPTAAPNPTVLGVVPGLAQRSSFDQADAPPPNFDISRFGLKPKRPVSLIGNPASPQPEASTGAKGKTKATDDDDIEYVTSPFEDR